MIRVYRFSSAERALRTNADCAGFLYEIRWPRGFVCPRCGVMAKPYRFARRPLVLRCIQCGGDTSLTAGTFMHGSRVPLLVWFGAIWHLIGEELHGATPVSALRFHASSRLRRYQTTTTMFNKIRAGMARLERAPIGGDMVVEVGTLRNDGETTDRRTNNRPMLIGAVETDARFPRRGDSFRRERLRLGVVHEYGGSAITRFMRDRIQRGTTVTTGESEVRRWLGREGYRIRASSSPSSARLLGILTDCDDWIRGTHHGVSARRLQGYLDEFSFRYNHRWEGIDRVLPSMLLTDESADLPALV